jgi:hypothetical protein
MVELVVAVGYHPQFAGTWGTIRFYFPPSGYPYET